MSLPKSWCVKNDGSDRFKDVVIEWMNENGLVTTWNGDKTGFYYGYNGSRCMCSKYISGTELTLDEFERLIEPEFEYGDEVEVRDSDNQSWKKRIFVGLNPNSISFGYVVVDDRGNVGMYAMCRKPKPKWEAEATNVYLNWRVVNGDRIIESRRYLRNDEAQAIAKALNELEEE